MFLRSRFLFLSCAELMHTEPSYVSVHYYFLKKFILFLFFLARLNSFIACSYKTIQLSFVALNTTSSLCLLVDIWFTFLLDSKPHDVKGSAHLQHRISPAVHVVHIQQVLVDWINGWINKHVNKVLGSVTTWSQLSKCWSLLLPPLLLFFWN